MPADMTRHDAEELVLDLPSGLKLAAKAWGPPEAPKVLALHGWLDNAASFDALAPLLPAVRLVALDLAGHGLSQHRHSTASYEFVEWIPDVLWAAAALGWNRFAILGHSLGAGIAPLAAAAAPDRVDRLVLLDGIGPLTAPAADAADTLALAVADRRRQPAQRLATYPDRQAAAERLVEANPALSIPAAHVLVARGTRDVEEGIVWRYDPRLRARSLLRLTEDQARAFLRAVRCPVLLIRPSQGWPVNESLLRARLECFADGQRIDVEGTHHVHLGHPQRVADHVHAFLIKKTAT